jgi:GR25 family glycosyltransferase involved in LPS biosynthesis
MEKWSQFGAIRCINLNERSDRLNDMKKLAKSLDMPIQFYSTNRHPDGGIRGCYESHLSIMKESLKKGLENVLILEDDAELGKFTWQRLREVTNFMKRESWDIIYLGCFPDIWGNWHKHIFGNIYKVHATQSHAYVASKKFMQRMVSRPFDGTPLDEVYANNAETYAILPSMINQSKSKSDVSSIPWISTFPAKKLITRGIEEYALVVGVPLRYCIAVILFVCVALKVWIATRNPRNG